MALLYRSTRGSSSNAIPASEAILKGLSPDGGLYVPTEIPKIDFNLAELTTFSYQELAFRILKLFYTDFLKLNFVIVLKKPMALILTFLQLLLYPFTIIQDILNSFTDPRLPLKISHFNFSPI